MHMSRRRRPCAASERLAERRRGLFLPERRRRRSDNVKTLSEKKKNPTCAYDVCAMGQKSTSRHQNCVIYARFNVSEREILLLLLLLIRAACNNDLRYGNVK